MPLTQLDTSKTLHVVVEILQSDFEDLETRTIDMDQREAYVYMAEVFERVVKKKHDYPGEIKFHRWPTRLSSEDHQILEISLVEWSMRRRYNEVDARFYATLKSFTGTEELKIFSGKNYQGASSLYSQARYPYERAMEDCIDELYEKLEERLPRASNNRAEGWN